MITGDNPLTACHISKELKMTKKEHTLILTAPSPSHDEWMWVSVDGTVNKEATAQAIKELKNYDLCVTGEVRKEKGFGWIGLH